MSCPKCGAPSKDSIKQNKHANTMIELNNQLSQIMNKNRKAKIILLVLIAVLAIPTYRYEGIVGSTMCCVAFLVILISDPYHNSIKKKKRRMKIETRFNDASK